MSKFTDRLWRDLVREHGDQLEQMSRPAAKPPKTLAWLRQPLFRPRMAAAFTLVGVVALNATGAFGLNVLGMHSALTATSLPSNFQSAAIANYGLLTETSVTCASFTGQNATPLGQLQYTTGSNGNISLVNPPQFFYIAGVTPTTSSASFTITETISDSTLPFLPLISGHGTQVFDSSCAMVPSMISYDSTTGTTTVAFTANPNQQYFLALKYSASNGLVGHSPPTSGTATYTFKVNNATPNDAAHIDLVPKH